jgi:hypothetical protein
MATSHVDIFPFDYATIPAYALILAIAKRRAGKTTWLKNVCNHIENARKGTVMVIAGTQATADDWATVVHPLYIYSAEDGIGALEKIKAVQNTKVREYKQAGKPFDDSKHHVTVIIDDCASNDKLMKSSILNYVASNGRHLHITTTLTAQYHTQVQANIRSQVDICIALSTSHQRNMLKIFDEFVSVGDIRIFKSVLKTCTDNYGALIINNTVNALKLSDNCFFAKIDPYPVICQALGSDASRKFGEDHYLDKLHLAQRLTVGEDDDDDSGEKLVFIKGDLPILDNRRVFSDSKGTIVIRKMLEKLKVE